MEAEQPYLRTSRALNQIALKGLMKKKKKKSRDSCFSNVFLQTTLLALQAHIRSIQTPPYTSTSFSPPLNHQKKNLSVMFVDSIVGWASLVSLLNPSKVSERENTCTAPNRKG